MAQPQLLQGSWEELAAHAEAFKGRHDLMLIVPGDATTESNVAKPALTLAEALKGKTGLVSFEPSDLSENTGKRFADLLIQKQEGEQP